MFFFQHWDLNLQHPMTPSRPFTTWVRPLGRNHYQSMNTREFEGFGYNFQSSMKGLIRKGGNEQYLNESRDRRIWNPSPKRVETYCSFNLKPTSNRSGVGLNWIKIDSSTLYFSSTKGRKHIKMKVISILTFLTHLSASSSSSSWNQLLQNGEPSGLLGAKFCTWLFVKACVHGQVTILHKPSTQFQNQMPYL